MCRIPVGGAFDIDFQRHAERCGAHELSSLAHTSSASAAGDSSTSSSCTCKIMFVFILFGESTGEWPTLLF